jgi:hypothetical protein
MFSELRDQTTKPADDKKLNRINGKFDFHRNKHNIQFFIVEFR